MHATAIVTIYSTNSHLHNNRFDFPKATGFLFVHWLEGSCDSPTQLSIWQRDVHWEIKTQVPGSTFKQMCALLLSNLEKAEATPQKNVSLICLVYETTPM